MLPQRLSVLLLSDIDIFFFKATDHRHVLAAEAVLGV